MFLSVSEIGFLTYWWCFIFGLMALAIGFAAYASRPKEKFRTDIEVLTVKSAQTVWVVPPPPSPPSRPFQQPNTFGAPNWSDDFAYQNAMREHEFRLQQYYERLAEQRHRAALTGQPVGYADHSLVTFDPYNLTLKAELGGKYKPGEAWRVSIKRGETTGEIYSFTVLERAAEGNE